MAIDKYTLKDGSTRYRVSVYMNGQRIAQKRGFKTKKAAKDYEASVRMKGARRKALTYENVERLYIDSIENTREESTVYQLEQRLRNHVPKEWRKRTITTIKPEECQRLANRLADQFDSAAAFVGDVSSVFAYAVKMDMLQSNPFDKIIKPSKKPETSSDKWATWTPEQIGGFLEATKDLSSYLAYPFFRLILFTGMRRGEALGLRWSDFDYDKKTVNIVNAITRGRNGGPVQSHPKNNSRRQIVIDDETADAIEVLRPLSRSERIFPVGTTCCTQWFLKAEKLAGLPHSRMHNLRHEHCTVLLENGAYLKDVQERLGHKNAETTLNIYAHASKDKRKVLDHLPENHYTAHSGER